MIVLRLPINTRLSNHALSDEEQAGLKEFAQWVLHVGEGAMPMDTREG